MRGDVPQITTHDGTVIRRDGDRITIGPGCLLRISDGDIVEIEGNESATASIYIRRIAEYLSAEKTGNWSEYNRFTI